MYTKIPSVQTCTHRGHVDSIEQINAFYHVHKTESLWGGHHHGRGDVQDLGQRELYVAGPRWHVEHLFAIGFRKHGTRRRRRGGGEREQSKALTLSKKKRALLFLFFFSVMVVVVKTTFLSGIQN